MALHIRAGAWIAGLGTISVMLLPALWNGFPLLQYDTGGYLARWAEGTLEESRSTIYGLPLRLLAFPDFWPAVAVQAALTVWVLRLTLRSHGIDRPWPTVVVISLLGALTALPWIASTLYTDVFAGLGVLSAYLLLFAGGTLSRSERLGLMVLIAAAGATHSATLLVLLGLLVLAALAARRIADISPDGLRVASLALAMSVLFVLGGNAMTARRLAWTPGGPQILFGRMLQDGIVSKFLADHCPDPRFKKLCRHRAELPTDADKFLWGQGLFDRLGRFKGLGHEMQTVVIESLAAYPLWQIEAAMVATARQLVSVATGEGVVPTAWHTQTIIRRDTPHARAGMQAARQQRGELSFTAINAVHRPVALLAMLMLLPLIVWGIRHRDRHPSAALAATVAAALLLNAVICGALANPHDRYGSRLAWLAPFALLVALQWAAQRRAAARMPLARPAVGWSTQQAS